MAELEDKPFDQAVMVHGARRAGPEYRQRSGGGGMAAPHMARRQRERNVLERSQGLPEALQGQGDAATARQAFRDAVKEADIQIGDAFRPPLKPKKRKR